MPITDYAFVELTEGSGRGTFNQDGQSPEFFRAFKIAWADLPGFILALKGGWRQIAGNVMQYVSPDLHPQWGGVYCTAASYEGIGLPAWNGTTHISTWEYAKVTATYSAPSINYADVLPQNIAEESFDFGQELLRVPAGSFRFHTTGRVITEPITLIIPTLTYTLSMPALPTLPGGNINIVMGLIGRVNDSPFGGGGAGKLLFMGMNATRKGTPLITQPGNSTASWAVQLKFMYRDIEWNKLYDETIGDFSTVELAGGGGRGLYLEGNLNQLLPSGQ